MLLGNEVTRAMSSVFSSSSGVKNRTGVDELRGRSSIAKGDRYVFLFCSKGDGFTASTRSGVEEDLSLLMRSFLKMISESFLSPSVIVSVEEHLDLLVSDRGFVMLLIRAILWKKEIHILRQSLFMNKRKRKAIHRKPGEIISAA